MTTAGNQQTEAVQSARSDTVSQHSDFGNLTLEQPIRRRSDRLLKPVDQYHRRWCYIVALKGCYQYPTQLLFSNACSLLTHCQRVLMIIQTVIRVGLFSQVFGYSLTSKLKTDNILVVAIRLNTAKSRIWMTRIGKFVQWNFNRF